MLGYRALPIANLPDFDLPAVNIALTQPGAAPAQLETEVARKVENSLATLSGIKHISTAIVDGQVNINAEFILEKNLSDALIEAKDAVDKVRSDLPTDLQQPAISAVRVGGEAALVYAVNSTRMDEEALQKLQSADPSLTFTKVSGTVDYTQEQFEGSMTMLNEGALLAVLVV